MISIAYRCSSIESEFSQRGFLRVARVILGATILLSILWANIPTAALASGPMCNLACCAGRAPHAAGSCMNGSCHAFLNAPSKKAHLHHEATTEQGEELCGLSRLKMKFGRLPIVKTVTVNSVSESDGAAPSRTSSAAQQASLSTTALTKPCQSDCGSCVSGFTSSNRQRNAAALAYADRPRPPSGVGLGNADYAPTQILSAMCRRGVPRGPPSSFA
jgi:hypothetical protein